MDALAFLARWNALPLRARTAAGLCAAAVLIALILASTVLRPKDAMLFADPLHPEQLSEVEERLALWNVPFAPSADNVFVDAGKRNALLLRLAMSGVPHAHVEDSSDALAKLGALTPQSVVDAQTRAGLAGDIELGLRGIDGVQDARVIIAPAKPGDFADESSQPASASVRLALLPGAALARDAVNGMREFVAASVPGLDARNVTILDDRGVALGEGGSGGDDDVRLAASLQSALDAAIGPGAAIVRVHVVYDERSLSSTQTRREPAAGPAIASQRQEERFSGAGRRYERGSEQSDRGSVTQQMSAQTPPGRVQRMSAAVFVDATRVTDLVPVRALAAATLGIDERRGDTLAVEAMPFTRQLRARKDGWWLAYGAVVPLLPTMVVAVAVLVALRWCAPPLGALVRSLSEQAAVKNAGAQVHGIAPSGVRARLAQEPPHTAAAIISALPAATAAAVLEMYPPAEREAIVRRMQRSVSPDLVDVERFVAGV